MRSRLAGVVIIVKIWPSFGSSMRQLSALDYSSKERSGPSRSIIEKIVHEVYMLAYLFSTLLYHISTTILTIITT